MAENSKRKPRKSKLVLRKCDFEDDRSDETKVFFVLHDHHFEKFRLPMLFITSNI